jgi:hypothetical protein
MDDSSAIIQFLPLFLLGIPFAIGNGYLAPRLQKNAAIWVIISLIPIINYFFAIYVIYQIIFAVLDRLKPSPTGD